MRNRKMQGVWSILIGVLAGISIAGGGYAKGKAQEQFDDTRFIATVLLGALAGIASWLFGGSTETWLDKLMLFATSSGLAVQLEVWIKVFKRRLKW